MPPLPQTRFDIASFGELVSDPSRVAMLLSLMDGQARPASELASIAGVTPQTASSHLSRLKTGGLVTVEQLGRHRYFRLASDKVADALEIIALNAVQQKRVRPERSRDAFAHARTCYKHLAGGLGVAWRRALEKEKLLHLADGALALSPRGIKRFAALDLSLAPHTLGKPCLDWTERQYHLGGPLGAGLTEHLFKMKWIARRHEDRALRITSRGRSGLAAFAIPSELLG